MNYKIDYIKIIINMSDYTFTIKFINITCGDIIRLISSHDGELDYGIINIPNIPGNNCQLYFNNIIHAANIHYILYKHYKDNIVQISEIIKF